MSSCSINSSVDGDRGKLLFVAVGPELLEISPKVAGLFFVLDARKNHFGVRDLGPGVLDVILECRLIPGEPGILVRVRIAVLRNRTGMTALKAVEYGTHLVFCTFADRMAGQAFLE